MPTEQEEGNSEDSEQVEGTEWTSKQQLQDTGDQALKP